MTSAATTEKGERPTLGEEASTKPPLPLFVNTVRVLALKFALIKSDRPSPLTSADVTHAGTVPTAGEEASTKPPLPLFINTDSVLASPFALIKSSRPSPLTSADVTDEGSPPTPGEEDSTKLPLLVPIVNTPWPLTLRKSTPVRPAPFPLNAPVRFTPVAPLVSTLAGSCPTGMTPVICPAETLPETAAAVPALADMMA